MLFIYRLRRAGQDVYQREQVVRQPGQLPYGQPRRRRACPGIGPYQRDGVVLSLGEARIQRDVSPYRSQVPAPVYQLVYGAVQRQGGGGRRKDERDCLEPDGLEAHIWAAGGRQCAPADRDGGCRPRQQTCARRIPANDQQVYPASLTQIPSRADHQVAAGIRQGILAAGSADGRQAGGVLIAITPSILK